MGLTACKSRARIEIGIEDIDIGIEDNEIGIEDIEIGIEIE